MLRTGSTSADIPISTWRGEEIWGIGASRRLAVPGRAEEMDGRGHFACIKRGRG